MTYSLSLLWWWGGFPSWHCYRLPPVQQTHQRQKFNDVWLIPTSHWTYIHKCDNSYAINRNASGCNAAQDGLVFIWTSPGCERAGMIQKWRVRKFNNAQNKLKGRSLLLFFSLFLLRLCLAFTLRPQTLLPPPSFYLFLLHPAHPACSNLWQMMVGWHQNGATGRGTVYTPHSSDKQRETPSDFLLCCCSTPIHFSWHANTCTSSEGLKAECDCSIYAQ